MAGFLERTVGAVMSATGMGKRNSVEERWWSAQAGASLAGQYVSNETASQLDVPQAVLARLAGTISTLPLQVFERTVDANGKEGRRVAKDHPLYRILHTRPNRRQTSQEFFDDQQQILGWWRNAYAVIRPGENPVDELEPVHPSRVQDVWRGTDGWVYYRFRRLAPAVGTDVYREDEVLHVRKAPLTADGLRGRPIWETGRETFGKAQAVEAFGALFFRNGGSGGGVLEHPGKFATKEDEQGFLETWRAGGTGLNAHKDRLLKYGVKYTPFSVKNNEAQFLETIKEMGVKLCRLWNMPPHLVGILDNVPKANVEQMSIEYVVHTLAPWIAAWEQALGRDLLIGEDQDRYFVEFNVAGLLRGDFKTRWASYAQGRQWGWLSVNDVRRLENMDPIGPEGDRYLEPQNMAKAGQGASAPTDEAEDDDDGS